MNCKHCGETFFRKVGEAPSPYCPTCVQIYSGDVGEVPKTAPTLVVPPSAEAS